MLYQFDSPETEIVSIERAEVYDVSTPDRDASVEVYGGLKYSLSLGDLNLCLKSRRRGKVKRSEKRDVMRDMRHEMARDLRDKLRSLRVCHFLAEIPLKDLKSALDMSGT